MQTVTVYNPATGQLRPAQLITDRAKRYRAQHNIETAPGPRRCVYCGAPRPRDIDHVDGREANGSPDNLVPACRSCNTRKGNLFAALKMGRKTRQFNPTSQGGAATLGEWMEAVAAIVPRKGARYSAAAYGAGTGKMTTGEAVKMIRATPHWQRSAYATEIWKRRHARAPDTTVPF